MQALLPIQIQRAMRRGAVSQIKIDEALIRNAHVFRNRFEIRDGSFVKPNRDLFLELYGVGIFPCRREIVLFAHRVPLGVIFGFGARRLPSGDDANDATYAAMTMTHKQQA